MKRWAVVIFIAATLTAAPQQQQQRRRPGEGLEPEWPQPSIRKYKPRSTLVVAAHPVARAKYPVVDVHSHQANPMKPEDFDRVVTSMDRLNLQVLINLSGESGPRCSGVQVFRWHEPDDT